MAMVSRNVPPRWAVTTMMPALGGASRMSCHSSAEKSDFVVIASPIVWRSLTLVGHIVATRFTGCPLVKPFCPRVVSTTDYQVAQDGMDAQLGHSDARVTAMSR